jgi:hypothetical protein
VSLRRSRRRSPPDVPLVADIVVSDESATFEFHLTVPTVEVTIEGSADAGLVPGASTTLTFSPPLTSSTSLGLDFYGDGDAGSDAGAESTGTPLFTCNVAGGLCGMVATTTGASFIVPDVPPQDGVLVVGGLVVAPEVTCAGVAGCEVGSPFGQSVAVETRVSP